MRRNFLYVNTMFLILYKLSPYHRDIIKKSVGVKNMLTIEDMKRDMDKDPKQKKSLYRQLEYFSPGGWRKRAKKT